MNQAILTRVNCIGITYVVGEIRDYHYEEIIEKILGVPESEVEGIDDRGNNRFIFEVSTNERYEQICETFTGRDITIGRSCKIQVDDISSLGTRVEISRVPFMVTNNMLSTMLREYGDVYKCQNFYRSFGKYRNLRKSGDRIVWIKLNKHIPQQLHIDKTQMTIHVYYPNQPMSCNKCGHTGHRERYCDQDPNAYKNIVVFKERDCSDNANNDDNINKGEDMEGSSESDINDTDDIDNNEDDNDIDIHIEPSQTLTAFECTECEYICKYENILKVHMQTHKGENSFKCDVCEMVNKDKSDYDKHMQSHANDILISCSECKYQCLNKDVLFNHQQTHHNIYACKECDFKGTTIQGLKGHIKIHRNERSLPAKRGLSASPEAVDSNKKTTKKDAKKKKN